jgi:hypothetical protein
MSNPTISPGYGYVICSHDDPKCSHYLVSGTWYDISGRVCDCTICNDFPTRKPVEIPDGWELVPGGDYIAQEDCVWEHGYTPKPSNSWPGYDGKQWKCTEVAELWYKCGFEGPIVIIRRKPVQPTVEPSKPAVDWSKPLQLKDGRKARFLALIKCPEQPRCCVVTDADGDEWVEAWCENGNYTVSGTSPLDIINTPERIKRDVWLNVYESGGITPWADKDTADTHALEGRIACVRVQIDCEKGEGL